MRKEDLKARAGGTKKGDRFDRTEEIRTSSDRPAKRPFDLLYEKQAAGLANAVWTLAPVPTGPAAAETLPPIVTLPPIENARTASSELRTTTKSVMSAPTWRPQPRPPVMMSEGADHSPSGRRATTRPVPERRVRGSAQRKGGTRRVETSRSAWRDKPPLPEKMKPALTTWKTAIPLALSKTAFGMALRAD